MVKHKNISEIKNVTTFEELAEYNDIIIKTAKQLYPEHMWADIVQEAYIKAKKYLDKGVTINSGYFFLIMKSIHLNKTKKNFTEEDITCYNILDDDVYNEEYYHEVDRKIQRLDEFLSTFLTQEEIRLWKFYKTNTLNITAIFENKKTTSIKYNIKKIMIKIKNHTNGVGITKDILK